MIKNIMLVCLSVLYICTVGAQEKVLVEQKEDLVSIKNQAVELIFNLGNGRFFLNKTTGENIIENACFQEGGLQSKDTCEKRTWTSENINDRLGKGKALTIKIAFPNYADILWRVTLYENQAYFIFDMGVENDQAKPFRLMQFYPLISNTIFPGKDYKLNYRVLDGNGGGSPTWVAEKDKLSSFNNLLVKFGDAKQPNILVAGGVSYQEFEKFVSINRTSKALQLKMYSEDPVGKLIDPKQTYWMKEKFYLNFTHSNPFEALELYADVLKKEQQITLNHYDFPTECLWYAAFYNNDTIRSKFNNTKGAVEEMDNAIKSGITKYTKVAIRLVPDAYGPNNQQGWWDDEHWAKYNEGMSTTVPHYTEPYLTTDSWCQAILSKGGLPFTYMQSGRRSEDFAKQHPDWMLFNDPYRPYIAPKRISQESSYENEFTESYSNHWWSDRMNWGYDFTDTGFVNHVKQVYARLKKAGIKGIFYDYPEATAWAYEGGFDNPYATTAWAYRQVFQLAKDGLGKESLLQERNVNRGSDITLGITSSQRVWGDTDGITPEMISRCGLRWYKNRTVTNYDMDSKDPSDARPLAFNDGNRSLLTMCYVTSGRFLLGRSFIQLSKEQLHDLSRTFPYHTANKSARPIDAFDAGVKFPRIYDFEVNPNWHQLTFYNTNMDSTKTEPNNFGIALSKSLNEGGLQLDASKQYYMYDFWNNRFVGLLNGSDRLEQTLRVGEARMISVHAKENNPQFIATNRHLMQGMLELENVSWNAATKTLSGIASVIGGEPFEITIALNNYQATSAKALTGMASLTKAEQGLVKLTLNQKENTKTQWTVKFK